MIAPAFSCTIAIMIEITLNGPYKNALGTEMLGWLIAKLSEADGKPLLLAGHGDAFSAGLDLKEITRLDEVAMERFLHLLERAMTALYLYPGPTVAAVNGHAIAGGCVIALACDHRVIADGPSIKIGLNEVALGLRFPPRIFSIVTRRMPAHARSAVLLGGGLTDPEGALRLGLVDEIAGDAVEVGRRRLASLAAHPHDAYAAIKRDLRGDVEGLFPTSAWERRLAEDASRWVSEAVRGKLRAMLAGRKGIAQG